MSLPVPMRKAVEQMQSCYPPPEGRSGFLRLDANENTAGPAPEVVRAVGGLTAEQISSYPEYQQAERRLARFFGVKPEELIVTNGVDDALRLVTDGYAESGEKVLLVEPTFEMYRFYAELLGAQVVTLRYDKKLRFPMEDVVRVLQRDCPRLLFLANPNNPTGGLLSRAELRKILKAARRTMVVVDEAYHEFAGETVAGWIPRRRNLIVTRTFSKAAGLAGLRVGCLLANREVTAGLRRVRPPYSVNAAGLAAALAAVRSHRRTRRYVREVAAARAELARALTRLGVTVYPSAANFLLADFGPRATALLARLRRRGILLRDRRTNFGRVGPVRITIGTREQMQGLIAALEKEWKTRHS
jgi:histidinol-phosphate aminotransferase